jgi:hypothetical protein
MSDELLSAEELDELEALVAGASPGPWRVFAGPGIGGDHFIQLGGDDDAQPDMYVRHDGARRRSPISTSSRQPAPTSRGCLRRSAGRVAGDC